MLTILSRERKAQNYGATVTGPWYTQAQCLGAFIRNRRKLARLSLRQLAETTSLSNAYLSQLERGMHRLGRALARVVSAQDVEDGVADLAGAGAAALRGDRPRARRGRTVSAGTPASPASRPNRGGGRRR